MNDSFRPVAPVRPAAAYIGGKKRLAEQIVARLRMIPHRVYAEPFVGMGGVFLRRRCAARCEIINDVSRDVTTLFRILQRHYPQFLETLKFQITSRTEFERLSAADPSTLTDLETAARFLYLQRLAFGGKVSGRSFGMTGDGGARFDVTRLGPVLEAIHERLAGVIIERLPWQRFISQYDAPDVLFYLDPPYAGCEDDYGKGVFAAADFDEMAGLLAKVRGRFLMSINDTVEIRDTFAGFKIEPIGTRYTVAGGGWLDAKELLISN